MVNLDNDTYLSEIDDIKPAESAPNKKTTGLQRENGSEPAVDLFPHAPKKIKPTKAESTNVKPCSIADQSDADFFVRKRSNRERHPSNSRDKRSAESRDKRPLKSHDKQPKPHEKRSSASHDNRPLKDTKNQARHHRERSEPQLKSAIVKAKERMQERSVQKRTVEVIASNRLPNHRQKRPVNRPPIQPSSTVTSGVFSRLEQFRIPRKGDSIDAKRIGPISANAATRIDEKKPVEAVTKKREFADASTQTDRTGPCGCSRRNQLKNRNRRETFKFNRDLVSRFLADH